jgi:alpha-L-arabinofuranosidase
MSRNTVALLLAGLLCGLWFTGLAAQSALPARVTVDARTVEAEIDPLLYGHFLEFMFEGVKGGLAAELVRDRGFDDAPNAIGLPRYWERYPDDRNDDYGLSFRWDDSVAYPIIHVHFPEIPVQRSLRVDASRGVVERRGVFQSRIPVRAGVELRGYLWIKTDGYEGPIHVALEEDIVGGRVHDEALIPAVAPGDWTRYAFSLHPQRDDPLARFAILFPGRGRVWLDQVSLLPGDAVDGIRADVLQPIRDLKPAFLRWPGGNVAQDYRWEWGIGPRDQRPTWVNLSWRNEPEPGDIGTAEYVHLARLVGAEPTLTVNVEGRGATAAEAAAWVEYCNGPTTSRYGALRAEHGHPDPFGVLYWEIGNEIWGHWVGGHSDAHTYAGNYRRYHQAMGAVDPGIRFIAVGDNDMEWNRTVLREAGDLIDYLAVHHYYGTNQMQGDLRNLMARPLHYERFYQQLERVIRREVPGRDIRLAINEWGLDIPESQQYSMLSALYGARLLNVFVRSSPFVAMSAVSDLVNGWPGGIIQASRHGIFLSPLYHVNRLWAENTGSQRVRARVTSPTYDASREGAGIPALDAVASRSADRRTLYLKLVNTHLEHDLDTRIELRGVTPAGPAVMTVLSAPDLLTTNGFVAPDAISPRRLTLEAQGPNLSVRLPKHSAAVVAIPVAP